MIGGSLLFYPHRNESLKEYLKENKMLKITKNTYIYPIYLNKANI
jgi:hypothetical protein